MDDERDIYNDEIAEELLENDEISAEEQGFIIGYLHADEEK